MSVLLLAFMASFAAAQGPPPGTFAAGGPPPGVDVPVNGQTGPPPGFDFLMPAGTDLTESRAPALVTVSVIGTIFATAFVAIRIYRTVQIRRFRGDDHLILASIIFHLATNALIFSSIHYGEGKHIGTITNSDHRTMAMKLSIIVQFVGTFSIVLAKISVGATLLQLKLGKAFDVLVVVCLIIATVGNFFASLVVLGGCRTRYLFYTGRDLPCAPLILFPVSTYFRATSNILVDAVFVFAPMWFLREIQLTPRDRLAMQVLLSFIFSATIFAVVNAAKIQGTLRNGIDMTWNTALILCFQCAEVSFCIMAACLPAIRHMLGKRFPKRWRFWQTMNSMTNSTSSGTHRGKSWFLRRGEGKPQFMAPNMPGYNKRDSGETHIMTTKAQRNEHKYVPMSIFDREKAIVDEDDEHYAASQQPRRNDFRLSEPFTPTSPTKVAFANEYRNTLRAQNRDVEKYPMQAEDEKPIFMVGRRESRAGSSGSEWTESPDHHRGQHWAGSSDNGESSVVSPMSASATNLAELDARHMVELEADRRVVELDGRRRGDMRRSQMETSIFPEASATSPRTNGGFWGRDRRATQAP
ncbi:hypothetical protein KVT40_002672 [Elsinoe batatas]|uniref:Rhodopsin domain-containing protein n=1 Tax=Elsinoe batatas TaxID=2601811 RepID=A0A8K0L456_9PEZI|nr:hypothetical protein KVT40_002672 [Elsinoe batatas]